MKMNFFKTSFVALACVVLGACSTTKTNNSGAAQDVRRQIENSGIPFVPAAFVEIAGMGDIPLEQKFLDAGMDINVVSGKATALMVATAYQKPEMVKFLIQHGADVNIDTYHGTALSIAAWNGNSEIGKILIQNGANVNVVSQDGFTPIMIAALDGNANLIDIMAQNGANVNAVHPVASYTPLMLAAYYGQKDAALELIKYGADVNYVDVNGNSVLDWSLIGDYSDIAKILVAHGAKVQMGDNNTVPRVILAALAHENIGMIDFLVDKGVSPNGLAFGKMPILIWCARANVQKSALELIKLGANPMVTDSDGCNTLDYAIINGEKELAKHLDPTIDLEKVKIPIDPNVQSQAKLVGMLIKDQYYQAPDTKVKSLESMLTTGQEPDTTVLNETSDAFNPEEEMGNVTTTDTGNKIQDFDKQIQSELQTVDSSINLPPPGPDLQQEAEKSGLDLPPAKEFNEQIRADILGVEHSLNADTANAQQTPKEDNANLVPPGDQK